MAENNNRTKIALELAPDAMNDLLNLRVKEGMVAERLLEKIWNGSFERFQERAKQSSKDEASWKISRSDSARGTVTLRCLVDPNFAPGTARVDVIAVEAK